MTECRCAARSPREFPEMRRWRPIDRLAEWAFSEGERVTGGNGANQRAGNDTDRTVGRTRARNGRKVIGVATLADHVWFVGSAASQRDLTWDARWSRPR